MRPKEPKCRRQLRSFGRIFIWKQYQALIAELPQTLRQILNSFATLLFARAGADDDTLKEVSQEIMERREVKMFETLERNLREDREQAAQSAKIEDAVLIVKRWKATVGEVMETIQLSPMYRDALIEALRKNQVDFAE